MALNFEFKQRLGSGNFGEVWLVNELGLGSICALKLIPPTKVINSNNFFQEAQILKSVEHPNIVKVNETGIYKDNVYVLMEFLDKGSLEDEAKGGYVHLSRAKKIMIDVLRALEHAHSKGIVHRDIKPANIMIGQSNEGKLSDFGLALPNLAGLNTSAIKDYQYIFNQAPEVNSFKDHTKLSDIYACGVTLYRLVNGDTFLSFESEFQVEQGKDPINEIRKKTIKGVFPNRNLYREFIPISFKKLINKAMHIDPSKRYQSAEEMRRALEKIPICANWDEQKLSNGMKWITGIYDKDKICHEVTRTKINNKYEIEVKKGSCKSSLRKINKLCAKNLSKGQAERRTKIILHSLVNCNIKRIES